MRKKCHIMSILQLLDPTLEIFGGSISNWMERTDGLPEKEMVRVPCLGYLPTLLTDGAHHAHQTAVRLNTPKRAVDVLKKSWDRSGQRMKVSASAVAVCASGDDRRSGILRADFLLQMSYGLDMPSELELMCELRGNGEQPCLITGGSSEPEQVMSCSFWENSDRIRQHWFEQYRPGYHHTLRDTELIPPP